MTGARPTGQCLSCRGSCIGSRFAVRHIWLLATLVVTVALLSGCAVRTDPATNVTATSATLNGEVPFDPSGHGTFWWEYSRDNGAHWTQTPHLNWGNPISPCDGSGTESSLATSTTLTGLTPSTTYLYRMAATVCGEETRYAGSNGVLDGDPPYEYDSFDTLPSGFSTLQPSVSDEFNGPAGSQPSTSKWDYKNWCNVPSKDQSESCFGPDSQHIFEDGNGNMRIRAIKGWTDPDGGVWTGWTTGHIQTLSTATPPLAFVVRAKVAPGYGMWSGASWLSNACMEVDSLEQLGRQPTGGNQSVHRWQCTGSHVSKTKLADAGTTLANDFHVYAAAVYAGHVDYYIDGTLTNTVYDIEAGGAGSWNMLIPSTFHISLDAGACGSWPDCPPQNAPSRVDMVVDWFRVYTP
jgi:hypothetical protein